MLLCLRDIQLFALLDFFFSIVISVENIYDIWWFYKNLQTPLYGRLLSKEMINIFLYH
jgi:hypothetical protein